MLFSKLLMEVVHFGQIWDLASGVLKLTLTGHIEQIRGKVQKSYWWWQQLC